MPADRYVVLGLARARAAWFGEVARWATAAALPIDFVKSVSVEEVRTRLRSGRPFSALLVDGGLPALDRDLVELAAQQRCAVIAVDDGRSPRAWRELGVAAVLPTWSAACCSTRCGPSRNPSPAATTCPSLPTRWPRRPFAGGAGRRR